MEMNILIVEDQEDQRERLRNLLGDEGYSVDAASSGKEALRLLDKKTYHIVLLDLVLPDLSGMEILKVIGQNHPSSQVIMLTAYGTIETAIQSMKLGAYDYITKPYNSDELLSLIHRLAEHIDTLCENELLKDALKKYQQFPDIVWKSHKMESVINAIKNVAPSDSTVLIQGESGTGKELVARAIHKQSSRRERPFVVVNCAAIQDTLLESELFGYEKGAFTGATSLKYGLVEVANEGTLFLDEVGDLSPAIQAKLLRFVEHGEFRRLGGNRNVHVDTRTISATNKDLEASDFRKDLLYRLNVFTIHIPSLRERKEDIPLLTQHFLGNSSRGKDKYLSKGALDTLTRYDWPGNVRELQNVIEQALILSREKVIGPEELRIRPAVQEKPSLSIAEVEREHIIRALGEYGGHRERAARALGMSVRTLYRKIKAYNIT